MNGSTENQTSGASDQDGGRDVVLTWTTSHRMLPLVQRITEDIVGHRRALARLWPEKQRLDKQRRTLAWPERSRRYRLQEEINELQRGLDEECAELDVLGVTLFDSECGQVGFPTIVNGRKAYFSWCVGEEAIRYWHFAKEKARRSVPANWLQSAKA